MMQLIKRFKVRSILVLLLVLFNIFIATLSLIPANKDVTAPGGLNEVKSVIKADTNTNLSGSFNTIYVYSLERVSVLQSWIASLANYNEVSDSSEVFHLSDEERIKSGQVQKNQSIEASLICAYEYAKKINPNIKLESSFSGFIIRNYQIGNEIFKIGDVITAIYDKETDKKIDYNSFEELANLINYELTVGDIIYFTRDGIVKNVEVKKEFDYHKYSNMFYCYAKYEIYETTANPSYTLYKSNTSGPSGGLMQTLSVYSQVTGIDYTFGKKIAGTGTISVNGSVGAIGGVSQKIVTAIHNNADVFLCPKANYNEAYETYIKTLGHEKMELICVSTFEEAVNGLRGLYENK